MQYAELKPQLYGLYIGNGTACMVHSTFDDGMEILLDALLEDTTGAAYGNTWNIAEALIKSGVDIVGWRDYHKSLADEYVSLLGGKPRLRDLPPLPLKQRKIEMWQRYEAACQLYSRRYLPQDVLQPCFLEGPPIKSSTFRNLAAEAGISLDAVWVYALRSFASQQMSWGPHESFDKFAWDELTEAGIVVAGEKIPLVVAIENLTGSEARTILGQAGIKPSVLKLANQDLLKSYAQSEPALAWKFVFSVREWHDCFCILPPPELAWADFQSWRQQLKGMAIMLSDLYGRTLRRGSPDYLLLSSNDLALRARPRS